MKSNNNNNKKAALSKSKAQILKQKKCFNRKAHQVDDPLFSQYDFFDPQDIIQVKYEMLRRVKSDGWTISKAAKSFGFSRPSFYSARRAFEEKGMPGLLPGTTGPKSPHKLTDQVLNYIFDQIKKDSPSAPSPSPSPSAMVKMIKEKFGFKIHVRTIQRALKKKGKKKR